MYKRPKAEETDEDLLVQQSEFLRKLKDNKIQLAAKLVNPKNDTGKDIPSKSVEEIGDNIQEHLANTFETIPANVKIGRIVEKRKSDDVGNPKSLVFSKGCGFPKARRRDVNIVNGSKSIFSQQIKRNSMINKHKVKGAQFYHQEEDVIAMDTDKRDDLVCSDIGNFIKDSKILTETDKNEIHEQNINMLKATPESEIFEEKERLLSTLDPALISFLKARRKELKPKSTTPSIHQQNEEGQGIDIGNIKSTARILENPHSEKWLNFDRLETHKLAWMKEIVIPKLDKNKAFEARFDFEGWLLPFTSPEITEKNRILYHHGEEPERPGYTLQELFTLARSAITQQKIIALNSIANILSLYSTGIYQDILDIPIEQLFFLIRFCLDDNTPGVLNASIKAMRSLVYNQIDEICLDCLLGFGWEKALPILPVDHEKEDDNTVNDQQLAEKNLIRCLVRTGIYTRIRYIINTVRPSLETIIYCLEILIRLSKDSEFVVMELYNTENLVLSIMRNFVPSTNLYNSESTYGTPLLQALKFVRLLCLRNKKVANEFVEKYSIVDSISTYLQDETFGVNSSGMKLQTECCHLWRTLLEYNLTLEHTSTLASILFKHLDYHLKHTDISPHTTYVREGHCAGVLILLGKLLSVKPSFVSRFETLIQECLLKWCRQFQRMESFKCGRSQIISSVIFLGTSVYGYSKLGQIIDENILILMKSDGFLRSTKDIKKCSMLLNNYEPHSFSANLKTLQASAWYTSDHVVPIIQTTSCLPFIFTLSQFVLKSDNYLVKLHFITHPNIKEYIESLQKSKQHFLTNHWFTRTESQLVMNLLKISVNIQKDLDTSIFYALAVKALCVFTEEQKQGVEFLLEKIIFCPTFYPSEVLLSNLDLNKRNENLEVSLSNLDQIRQVYSDILGIKMQGVSAELSFCIDVGIGNIIPVDWIYTPILLIYSNQQEKRNELSEEKQIFVIKNCLRWILIYETYFPSLVAAVNPTDRFCRLACVFLGSDGLFLNTEIHHLLELCLKNILEKYENKLDFDKQIEGLKHFQDFYNQMLEQYQGVSYGDILFGNFVMVPLSQNHNSQWRRTLWSEYIGAVQILNIPKEKLLTKLDNYLNPPEDDESLIKCYKMALSRNFIRQNSVLYSIASHHYKEYMNRKTSVIEEKL